MAGRNHTFVHEQREEDKMEPGSVCCNITIDSVLFFEEGFYNEQIFSLCHALGNTRLAELFEAKRK
jgi:hypothetical protein